MNLLPLLTGVRYSCLLGSTIPAKPSDLRVMLKSAGYFFLGLYEL